MMKYVVGISCFILVIAGMFDTKWIVFAGSLAGLIYFLAMWGAAGKQVEPPRIVILPPQIPKPQPKQESPKQKWVH